MAGTATVKPTLIGYFECRVDGHNKWWAFKWFDIDNSLVTFWGPIGTIHKQSQSSSKFLRRQGVENLIADKLAKGYVQLPTDQCPVREHLGLETMKTDPFQPVHPDDIAEPVRVNADGAALRRRRGG